MIKKVALVVEYKGTNYKGWQAQKSNLPTIQDYVEKALSVVANHKVSVICAGRTDANVHATGQVIHFETTVERPLSAWIAGGNSNLPKDIAFKQAFQVPMDFHARFSAINRRYRYIIYQSDIRPAILSNEVTWTYKTLDIRKMIEASECFVGTHDFTSFRAVGCQAKSPIRTILNFDVYQQGRYIILDVRANAFLHHMIRNFAGVLMTIGADEKPVIWAKEVLEAKDRTKGGITGPPDGLYFVHAEYPEEYALCNTCTGPHFLPEFKETRYDMSC